MHLTEKFKLNKYFSRNNIIPTAFSVFSISFVVFIVASAIEHYLIKYIF
jgi:hypothetical protein